MNSELDDKLELSKEEAKFIEELIIKNNLLMQNVLRLVLRNLYSQLADECISDVHLLACKRVAELMTHPNPDGWLIEAIKLKGQELLRKRFSKATEPLIEAECNATRDVCFDELLYKTWSEQLTLDDILSVLSKRERTVYNMIYIENKNYGQIAEELGITRKTVLNTNLALRKKIEDYVYNNI